jgi:hypothetical protein
VRTTQETLRNLSQALVELRGTDRGVAEAPGAIGDAQQLAPLTRTPHREPPRKVDKAGGGDNPEGATDTRVGNSSRASGCRLGMGDSVEASEGGDDEAALQAQRKRPRKSSIGEVALVRQRLLACVFPGVQDKMQVPQLKVLLFEHGLAMRLVCPERELWKVNGTPAESKWHGVHVACAWKAWLDSQETQAALLRRGVNAGASAPTTRGAAEHETAGCGEAGGGFKDVRRAAGERGSAAPHTAVPHRLVVWDCLAAAYCRLKGSTHRDKIDVLQKLSVRLSKLHLSPLGSPTRTRETDTTVFSEMDTLLQTMDTSDW